MDRCHYKWCFLNDQHFRSPSPLDCRFSAGTEISSVTAIVASGGICGAFGSRLIFFGSIAFPGLGNEIVARKYIGKEGLI